MATQLESDPLSSCDNGYFAYALPSYYRSVLKQFRKISRSFVNFHGLFFALFAVELSLFFVFLPILSGSSKKAHPQLHEDSSLSSQKSSRRKKNRDQGGESDGVYEQNPKAYLFQQERSRHQQQLPPPRPIDRKSVV